MPLAVFFLFFVSQLPVLFLAVKPEIAKKENGQEYKANNGITFKLHSVLYLKAAKIAVGGEFPFLRDDRGQEG